mmetsp:Transcript_36938/g.111650  ORF Transcript_36938/g.111650 Transcript_36938/m.111650 type:complete len:94 (-) Transcript_36938:560-841(-)
MAEHAIVEILAPEVRIARRGPDLEHRVLYREDRDVEGAAAHVEDQDVGLATGRLCGLALRVEPVRDRGGGRLVDDAGHAQAGNLSRVLGRLPL